MFRIPFTFNCMKNNVIKGKLNWEVLNIMYQTSIKNSPYNKMIISAFKGFI